MNRTPAHPAREDGNASKFIVKMRLNVCFLGLSTFLGGAIASLRCQTAGPQAPVNAPKVIHIPTTAAPPADAPPIPPEEIIRRFSLQEDELARAITRYVYRKSIRVEEIGADGKTSGKTEIVMTPVVASDGVRWQRPPGEPESTLKYITVERDDLEALSRIPLFPFGSAQASRYQFTYQGKQPIDELTTYIFRVSPRQLDPDHAYFDGIIWVDDHDFVVVRTYGRWVTPSGDMPEGGLPFTLFETYRQLVENKYWMPAYLRSDSSVTRKNGSAPVRLVIVWDKYSPLPVSNHPVETPAGEGR